ncbi:MAG TPA: hypothetical protein VGQ83_13030 [Polyangia bacterium]|jgi:hypothetical protein
MTTAAATTAAATTTPAAGGRRAPVALDRLFSLGLLLLTFTFTLGSGLVAWGLVPLAAAGVWAAPRALRARDLRRVAWPALYLVSILVSLAFSPHDLVVVGSRAAVHVIGFVLFLHLLRSFEVDEPERTDALRRWSRVLALAGAVVATHFLSRVISLLLAGQLAQAFMQRYVGGMMSISWGASNNIAGALLLPLFACLAVAGMARRHRSLEYAVAGLMALAIIATLSRNAMATLVIVAIVYVVANGKLGKLAMGALVALAVGAILALVIGEDAINVVVRTRGGSIDEIPEWSQRTDIWNEMVASVERTFPVPIGLYGCINTFKISPHNFVLLNLAELGLWGLVAFVGMLGSMALGLWRRRAAGGPGVVYLFGLLAIVINTSFEDPQYTHPYIIFFWAFAAIATELGGGARRTITVPAKDLTEAA